MKILVQPRRPDWQAVRETIDLAEVATSLLGPPPGRRGERGRRLWWVCPFHEDRNPSFVVDPARGTWKCFGCGEHGDAASLVMRLEGVGFPEAAAILAGNAPTRGNRTTTPTSPATTPRVERPADPSGLPEADALALVDDAERRLWLPEGADALRCLTEERRLDSETIKAHRLGWTPGVSIPTRGGNRSFQTSGIIIPWFVASGRLAMAKVRRPPGSRPKYTEAFRDPSRVLAYPSLAAIRPGRPVVVVEGEFDALVVGQALGDRASVITLGGASNRPDARVLASMMASPSWFVAHDGDPAGDRAAAEWPARARRVRPPVGKDWTDVAAWGVDLSRWWGDVLDGIERPPLFSWDELSTWRWGGASVESPEEPGFDIEPPAASGTS